MARFCLNIACVRRANDDHVQVCRSCHQTLLVHERYFLSERLSTQNANAEVWQVEDWGYWQNPSLDLDDQDAFETADKVIKILKFHDYESIALLKQEYQILLELKNRYPHLPVPSVSSDSTKSLFVAKDAHCLVMSQLSGRNLATWLEQNESGLDAPEIYRWLQQLSEIVAQLHQAGICHLDLHPGNILLNSDGQLSLVDFGCAAHYPGICLRQGIEGYAAPELHQGRFEPSSDYFALARTLVHLCTGKHPAHLFGPALKQKWRRLAPQLPSACVALLNDLMEPSVQRRAKHVPGLKKRLYALQFPVRAGVGQVTTAACLSLVATGLVVFSRLTGVLMGWELQVFDMGLRLRPHEPLDERIVIVAVDAGARPKESQSISDLELLTLLKQLQTLGATTIGLDLYRDFPVESEYSELVAYLQQDNLFGVCNIADPTVERDVGVEPPPEIHPDNIGYADALDDGNRMIRRHLLVINNAGQSQNPCPAYLDFTFLLALHYLETAHGITVTETSPTSPLQLGGVTLQELSSEPSVLSLNRGVGAYQRSDLRGRQVLLNYRSRPKLKDVAHTVTLSELTKRQVAPEVVKDRIVLIGAISSSSFQEDRWQTPHASNVPGVVVQTHKVSQLISSVLDRRPLLWVLPAWAEGLWIWGWSMAAGIGSLLLWRFPRRGLLFVMFLFCGVSVSCYVLLLQAGWFPLIPVILSMVITVGLVQLCDRTIIPTGFIRRLPGADR